MALYRRLGDLPDRAAIDGFAAELIDRFGPLPTEAKNLLLVVEAKQEAKAAGIARLEAGARGGLVTFVPSGFPAPQGLLDWLTHVGPVVAKLRPDDKLFVARDWNGVGRAAAGRGATRAHARQAGARRPGQPETAAQAARGQAAAAQTRDRAGRREARRARIPGQAEVELAVGGPASASSTRRQVASGCAPITARAPFRITVGTPVTPAWRAWPACASTAARSASPASRSATSAASIPQPPAIATRVAASPMSPPSANVRGEQPFRDPVANASPHRPPGQPVRVSRAGHARDAAEVDDQPDVGGGGGDGRGGGARGRGVRAVPRADEHRARHAFGRQIGIQQVGTPAPPRPAFRNQPVEAALANPAPRAEEVRDDIDDDGRVSSE